MMVFAQPNNLDTEHRQWLDQFDPQYRLNWDKLHGADEEAAMCEAAVRRVLQAQGVTVDPNENLNGEGQAPDFRCNRGGRKFYVEVTCLAKEKVTQKTALSPCLPKRAFYYNSLNEELFRAGSKKTPQCSNLDSPALVAVGTFHFPASALCFERDHLQDLLTGDTMIACNVDTATGEPVGEIYQSTHLRSAPFLRPMKPTGFEHARNPVAGILACGFGCPDPQIRGVLHPDPVHAFDRSLLPGFEFCRLRKGYESKKFMLEWI